MAPSPKSLRVLIPRDTGQRFSCQSCTQCCRNLVVDLTDRDRKQIDAGGWQRKLDADPYVRLRGKWVLNKDEQGRCVFLSDAGRCRIHQEQGFDAKPLACRLFPFTLTPAGRSVRAGWRFDCPTVARSQGKPVDAEQDTLGVLARELLAGRGGGQVEVQLKAGLPARSGETGHLVGVLDRWLGDGKRSPADRVRGAIWLTSTLQEAQLEDVREERFVELVELLVVALPAELSANIPSTPSTRQLGMLRQLAFAHTGHVSFAEMRAGRASNLARRWTQLRFSRRFRRGRGAVPSVIGGHGGEAAFDDVDRVQPHEEQADRLSECVLRYLRGKLQTRSCFGPAYYGWAALDGLSVLWLSVAVIGWWARYFAAIRRAVAFGLEDLVRALGVVDAGVGRIPILGSRAERLRLRFLQANQGIASLVERYSPCPAATLSPNC